MVEYCAAFDPLARAFVSRRTILSLVCRFWFAIIYSVPSLWTVLCIDHRTDPDHIRTFLGVVQNRRFTVSIFCACRFYGVCSCEWGVLRRTLQIALHSVLQWDRLYFYSNSLSTIQAFLNVFIGRRSNTLTGLSITHYGNARSSRHRSHLYLPPLPYLSSLELFGARVPWRALPFGLSLRKLTFTDIPKWLWPNFDIFVACMRAAPNLVDLSICNAGCLRLPAWTSTPVVFDSIRRLRLGLGGYDDEDPCDIMLLIRLLRFPMLQVLELEARSEIAIAAFTAVPLFEHVRSVELLMPSACVSSMVMLYATLPSVAYLDLRRCTTAAVVAIGCRSGHNRKPVLPFLTNIFLVDHQWVDLRLAIRRRRSLCSVFHLTIGVYRLIKPFVDTRLFAKVYAMVYNIVWMVRLPTQSVYFYIDALKY